MPDAADEARPGTDDELMRRTAAGDREAFAAVYRRHHASVYRFARLMTGSNVAAEDVVQDVFVALMRHAGRFDARRAALSTYLFGIARHHTRRRLARERRFVALEDARNPREQPVANDAVAGMEREQDVARLRRALLSLPSRYREVVVLCDLQDMTYHDTAVALGCAVGTVRSRLHRARHLLADKIRRAEHHQSAAGRAPVRYAV